jgi:DNA replication protein DnaC
MQIMLLKQETAAQDSAAIIEEVTKLFQIMNLPRLADKNLYFGTPFSILESFCQALNAQHTEDEKKRFINRLKYAGITRERTVDAFKWDNNSYPFAQPGVIENALTIDFIHQHKNLVVVGPPGTGKSSLVIIVACKAIREGISVRYKTAHNIAVKLREARDGNSLSGYIKMLQACDVLVIEDLTYAHFDLKTAQSFFSVIDGRYGRKTTIITSNASIREWALGFPDKRMCSALLGRFYEEALLVNMNGAVDMRLEQAKDILEHIDDNDDKEPILVSKNVSA